MNKQGNLILGMALGAGLMYLLDPDRGRRRRALLRDQVVHGGRELEELKDAAAASSRDLQNRIRGVVAETRNRLRREDVDDSVLEARVRSEIGRLVANPRAIFVTASNGRITLSGPVLADEVEHLLSSILHVRGVSGVVNQLDVHQSPGDVPGLQGTSG
jgi:osmotically-inducible protein OsmY